MVMSSASPTATKVVRRNSSVAGPAIIVLVIMVAAPACGFVFGTVPGVNKLRHSVWSPADAAVASAPGDAPSPLEASVLPAFCSSLAALVSVAAACGLVARLGSSPAYALADMNDLLTIPPKFLPPSVDEGFDPEVAAVSAREELTKANEDKKVLEKEARLQERMAIRRMVEEKKKAEDIITENVKAELVRIKAERVFAEEQAVENEKAAKAKAIAANQAAEDYTQAQRSSKVQEKVQNDPKKQVLAKALDNRRRADEEAAERQKFTTEALARLENAERLAVERKAEVEKAVIDLAEIPSGGQ